MIKTNFKFSKKLENKYIANSVREERELNCEDGYRLVTIGIKNCTDKEGIRISELLVELYSEEFSMYLYDYEFYCDDDKFFEFQICIDEEYIKEFNKLYKEFKSSVKEILKEEEEVEPKSKYDVEQILFNRGDFENNNGEMIKAVKTLEQAEEYIDEKGELERELQENKQKNDKEIEFELKSQAIEALTQYIMVKGQKPKVYEEYKKCHDKAERIVNKVKGVLTHIDMKQDNYIRFFLYDNNYNELDRAYFQTVEEAKKKLNRKRPGKYFLAWEGNLEKIVIE